MTNHLYSKQLLLRSDDAPNGGSNLFILVNAPYLDTLSEDPTTTVYANKIISDLENRGLTRLSQHIQYQEIRSPFTSTTDIGPIKVVFMKLPLMDFFLPFKT